MLTSLALKVQRKGFAGPYYSGMRGKLRFLLESTVTRRELILVATPESFAAAPHPRAKLPLEIHPVRRFEEFEPFRTQIEKELYPGYVDAWRAPFTWGEEAVVGTVHGAAALYNWMQFGTRAGYPTYYGRIFEGEARLLRAGVLPSFRQRGLNTWMKYRLLERFFAAGITRVYVECYLYNLPSLRSLLRVGFAPAAVISVIEIPGLRGFVRWAPVQSVVPEFQRLGIDLEPARAAARDGTPM